jgi:hypothetical protein
VIEHSAQSTVLVKAVVLQEDLAVPIEQAANGLISLPNKLNPSATIDETEPSTLSAEAVTSLSALSMILLTLSDMPSDSSSVFFLLQAIAITTNVKNKIPFFIMTPLEFSDFNFYCSIIFL